MNLLWEKAPLFFLAAVFGIVAVYAQHRAGALTTLRVSVPERLANASMAYLLYIQKAVWPSDLMPFYPYLGTGVTWWQAAAAGLVLAAVTLAVVASARSRPYLTVGWLWYLGTLVPVIGLVSIGWQGAADRYAYVPLLGLFIAVAWAGAEACGGSTFPMRRWAVGTLAVGSLAFCAAVSWTQEAYWHDSIALWRHALSVTSGNPVAHTCLGDALEAEGRLPEATRHFEEAARLDRDFANAQYRLGLALLKQGEFHGAARHLTDTLRLEPDFPPAHFWLGVALEKQGQLPEAVQQYRHALRTASGNARMGYVAEVHFNLGRALAKAGRADEAAQHYEKAFALNPDLRNARTK
jgi:tetratricopeptide (TPR) repeat protein